MCIRDRLQVPYIFAAVLMLGSLPFLLLRQRDLVHYTILLLGASFALFIGYLLSVSYTHLDVYKRQAYWSYLVERFALSDAGTLDGNCLLYTSRCV